MMEKIPGYIEILDKNIKGRLTAKIAGDPHGKRRFIELSDSKLKSIKIFFDTAMPKMQSMEFSASGDLEMMSSDDILARMKLLIAQRPELLEKLLDQNTKLIKAEPVERPAVPIKYDPNDAVRVIDEEKDGEW